MTFDRDKLVKKPKGVKAIFTSNGRESERKQPETKSDKPFYERMGIWGYTISAGGVGIGIGALFGGFAYALMATTDEKLMEDVKYYKEQYRIESHEKDSLEAEIELLISERETLQERLKGMQQDNNSLDQSLKEVNDELKQYKDLMTDSNSIKEKGNKVSPGEVTKSEEKEISRNESISFFDGEINVAAVEIVTSSTTIQVGAPGHDSKKYYSASVGEQFNYESDSKYQIRVTKINYLMDKIVIQVTEI